MKTTTIHTIQKLFAKRVLMLIATVMMASGMWARMGSPYTCVFEADMEESSNQVITQDITWTISRTVGKGSPTTTFGNQSSQSAIKFGSGSSNYYSNITLTTSDFSDRNVTKVVLYISSNNGGSKTITVTQGATQIGTGSQSFTSSTWVDDCTRNTTAGSGGNLTIAITSDATATFIHSIEVTYTGGPKHTVTFNAGTGSCGTSSLIESTVDGGVLLPSASPSAACAAGGWVFAGWKQTSAQTETTSIPTLYEAGTQYYPRSSETLYAVYSSGTIYTIDFESAANTYSNWTFSKINSQQVNANVTAHSGSYLGLTTNSNPNSVQTNAKIATPKMVRFYISRTSSNANASTWQVYTSTDGSNWTSRKSQDATSMKQGKWLEVSQDLSSYTNVFVKIEYTGNTAIRAIDDVTLSCATYNSNPSCCANAVSLSKGTESNGTITLGATGIATCSATPADRQVTISVTPAQGYDAPETLAWTQTSGTTFTAPTKVSGPTKNGTQYDYVYQFPQNASGAGTFGVSGRAFTNFRTRCCTESNLTFGTIASPVTEYVIVRQDLAKSTDSVSIDCNFESLNTSEITWYKTSWAANTFPAREANSRTTPAGQLYIRLDVANKTLKSNSTGVYTVIIQQEEAEVSGTTYCGQQASVTVTVKTVDKFVDAVNGNFSGEPQGLEDIGGGILLPTEETFSTNNGCSDGIARRLIGWIKASDLNVGNSSYKVSGRVNYIDDLKTGDASNKVIAPGTRVAATGITWYAVWGVEQE